MGVRRFSGESRGDWAKPYARSSDQSRRDPLDPVDPARMESPRRDLGNLRIKRISATFETFSVLTKSASRDDDRHAVVAGCAIRGASQPSMIGVDVSSRNTRHVVPNKSGGWDVKKPGASRSSAHVDTQKQGQDRAREIVRKAGGGEVRVHGRDGRIRDSDTVAPGNDPNPPRDKR